MRPSDALDMILEEDEPQPNSLDFDDPCVGCGCTADQLEEVIARCSACSEGPYCMDCFMGKHLDNSPGCDQ